MLFNTLTYAHFFAVVFVAVWLLTERRWAPLVPWLFVAAYAVQAAPSAESIAVVLASLLVSLGLCRVARDGGPSTRVAAASVVSNLLCMGWLTFRRSGIDPVNAALGAFDAPAVGGPGALLLTLGAVIGATQVVRARRVRLLFILGASYVFYAHWDYRFLPLIFGSSSIDWLLGNAIARETEPKKRRRWIKATVFLNLGVLGVFKYFNFGIDSARVALEAFGFQPPETALQIALPVGISFFTFESMSYVIDVYRGHIQPHKSYTEYLAFVAFFPHLVAGPIVRPRDLLPQLGGKPRFNAAEASEGIFLIATGLLKKIAIGDYIAINLIDRIFDAPAQFSAVEIYTALIGYSVQIYCDFSGYTDIAIGSALLLGVRFPLNFDAPYKSRNIQEFWRRWHISLSTWLRDYLYVPLGGNRLGPVRTYVNLVITMVLGGLWHGAAWTYVLWGGLHGVALAFNRFTERRFGKPKERYGLWSRVIPCVVTFHYVSFGWILFRADSFQTSSIMLTQLGTLTTYTPNLHPTVMAVLGVGLVSHFIPEKLYQRMLKGFIHMPAPAQAAGLFVACLVLREMAAADAVPFVYFQF